jgi:alkylation response protein AidB-like acyl-CoA dehydrogenase
MNFSLSEEQEELRRVLRQFLESKSPEAAVRSQMASEPGFDRTLWSQMADQLGLQGIAVPEAYGGSGFSLVELAVVLEEMGRSLLCSPYLSSVVLAGSALLESGDESAMKRFLPGIASGDTVAALALTEPAGRWDGAGVEAVAEADGDGWRITGTKSYVLDGAAADLLLVAARSAAGGISLFAVDGNAPGMTRTQLPTLDQTRKQARLDMSDVPAELVGADGGAWAVVQRVLELAAVGLAAEQVGGAQRCLDMAVDYAKVRVQFGRPIGSFQAIKHKCADMLVRVESARSAAYYAAWCAAERNDELPLMASLAKSYCSEAYFSVAADNIQVHGAIGFTWEHPAHLYFKRAKTSELLFGDPTYHRRLLAGHMGLSATVA